MWTIIFIMAYKSSPVGNEISCVMHGINKEILNDPEYLERLLLDALNSEKFNILGKLSHKFNPHGVSVLILLSESHASFHTYPEYNSLVFHIYTCRGPGDGRKTYEFIKEKLNPTSVDFREKPIKVVIE